MIFIDVNSQLFPLNTNTYPMTRGIKVEIAGIVILFMLGIISQLKVWKLVKERREKKAAAQLEREREREEYETHLGKEIEQHNAKARKQWEKVYGDKTSTKNEPADSGVGSSGNSYYQSSSVKDHQRSQPNSIELSDVPDSTYASSSDLAPKANGKEVFPRVSVRALSDDDIQEIDAHGNPIQRPPAIQEETVDYANSMTSSDFQRSSVSIKGKSLRPSVGPPPIVLPVPFEGPSSEASGEENIGSAKAEVQTKARNNRFSQLSMANRLSTVASLGDDLEIPHLDDDHRSSLAATLDENLDEDALPKLSPFGTPLKTEFGEDALKVPEVIAETKSERAVNLDSSDDLKPMESLPRSKSDTDLREMKLEPKPAESTSLIPPVDPAIMQAASASLTSSTRPKEEEPKVVEHDTASSKETSANEPSVAAAALSKQLPNTLSKIALSYRTNEWAKHLDSADEPEDQPESRPTTPGVTVEIRAPQAPTAVKSAERQEHVKEAKRPANVARNSSSSSNVYRMSKAVPIYASQASSSTSLAKNNSADTIYNANAIQRNVSQSSMRQATAQFSPQMKPNINGNRSSSMPLTSQPLVESPVEEAPMALPAGAFARMNPSQGTLLGIAEKKRQDRTSSALLNRQSSLQKVGAVNSSDSSFSNENSAQPQDDDDIPLSQRKSMMQAQRKSSAPARQQSAVYDSHQPKRSSTVDTRKQAANLALWRDSVRSDMAQKSPGIAEGEEARAHMMMQRQNSQLKLEQQATAAQRRESMMDDMMRRGNMLDLHREKMRKMQAAANKKAS